MFEHLIELVILLLVIVDPLMSTGIFYTATQKLKSEERNKIALIAISIAIVLSALFLFFGEGVLKVMQVDLKSFQIGGGVILGLLGIQMVLGRSSNKNTEKEYSKENARAIASVIGTPLLTGPATITTIIVSTTNFGIVTTGFALIIVFLLTYLLLRFSPKIIGFLGQNAIQIITTLLGMLTLTYGVIYIKAGFGI